MDRLERRDVSRWLGVAGRGGASHWSAGCETPSAHTISRNYGLREGRAGRPARATDAERTTMQRPGPLFKLYCGSCHNARPLGERPFSNYHVAVAHMRDQAYLTGKEYRQIIFFLRRWDDVGPPTPGRRALAEAIHLLAADRRAAGRVAEPADPAPPPAGPSPWQQPGAEERGPLHRSPPAMVRFPRLNRCRRGHRPQSIEPRFTGP